jgi:hypothetical protein
VTGLPGLNSSSGTLDWGFSEGLLVYAIDITGTNKPLDAVSARH